MTVLLWMALVFLPVDKHHSALESGLMDEVHTLPEVHRPGGGWPVYLSHTHTHTYTGWDHATYKSDEEVSDTLIHL